MSTISASTTTTTAYKVTADTTGTLVLQTGSTPTTAVTIGTDQSVTFAQTANLPNTFGFKNRLINGQMQIDQRNAGASFTNSNTSVYGVDRWLTSGLSSAVLTFQQVADAPAGYKYSFKCTVTTSTTTNDTGGIVQRIEASNVYDLMWGNTAGQTATLSFWVKASTAGTYCAVFTYFGGTATYYYVSPYTVTANTWTQINIQVPAAPTGAGDFSGAMNTSYMYVQVATLGSSGNTTYATANTWSSTAAYKTSGSVNFASTGSATLQFTGVQLEKGSTATSFDYRPYGTELALCQRYCPVFNSTASSQAFGNGYYTSTTNVAVVWPFPVPVRAPVTGITATAGVGFQCAGSGSISGPPTLSQGGIAAATLYFPCTSGTTNAGSFVYTQTSSSQIIFNGCEL